MGLPRQCRQNASRDQHGLHVACVWPFMHALLGGRGQLTCPHPLRFLSTTTPAPHPRIRCTNFVLTFFVNVARRQQAWALIGGTCLGVPSAPLLDLVGHAPGSRLRLEAEHRRQQPLNADTQGGPLANAPLLHARMPRGGEEIMN